MTLEARDIAYSYPVAPDHPSGLFWIHPHHHGHGGGPPKPAKPLASAPALTRQTKAPYVLFTLRSVS